MPPAGPRSTRRFERIRERRASEALGIVCNRGDVADLRSASPSQLDALRSATSSLTRNLEHDPQTRDSVREIGAMRAEVGTGAGPGLRGASSDQSTAEDDTPVDGLWRMNTTADELARDRCAGRRRAGKLGRVRRSPSSRAGSPSRPRAGMPASGLTASTPSRGASSTGPWRMGAASAPQGRPQQARGEVQLQVEPLPRPAHAAPGEGRDLSGALPRQAVAADGR